MIHALQEATETPEDADRGLALATQAFTEETPERGEMMRDFMAVWLRMPPKTRDAVAELLTGGDIRTIAARRGVTFQAVHQAVVSAKVKSEALRKALPHIGRKRSQKNESQKARRA